MADSLRKAAGPLAALAAALVLSSLIMLAFHANPVRAFAALFQGALGSEQGLAETLVQSGALIFAGLGVALAFRAGLFNIGAEGQLVVGGLCTAVAGAALHLPTIAEVPLCLAAGALGGAVWGGIAGVLRARFGASEVITTIMLNYVAFLGSSYLVGGPLRGDANAPETAPIAATAILPPLIADTRLTAALPLALAIAFAFAWWLRRSVAGYELRAAGSSDRAARYAGVDPGRVIVQAMLLSGALAGLAGATEVLGLLHRFNAALSPGYGFTSIAVALLGGSDPIGVILSAFFFGALQNGALAMQALAGVPKDLVSVVEGLIILFIAARRYLSGRLFIRRPATVADAP
ncbi:MAG TPA: ABC transporter permease [Candidatus Eremiobacteraceae bacterium]|nr:ABC transporter permease [Candidatus Eremiobacteraceae bacterium]